MPALLNIRRRLGKPGRILFVFTAWCLMLAGSARGANEAGRPAAVLSQPQANVSDFDVTLPGSAVPSFRLLLPEALIGEGRVLGPQWLHCVAGRWRREGAAVEGEFDSANTARFTVRLEPRASEVWIALSVTNTSSTVWRDVRVDICAAVNHVPGTPDWANPDFLPGQPIERFIQGRAWFERVTPHNLKALTDQGWVEMHPDPDRPSAAGRDPYSFIPSARDNACACAVASADGTKLFFQAWEARCEYATPCPGNACMHLRPLVARTLGPGETATIRGVAGILVGSRRELEQKLRQSNFQMK